MPFTQANDLKNAISATFILDGLQNGSEIVINDANITTMELATAIAKAKFLEEGYINQVVEFVTDFVDININDIISVQAPSRRIPRELNKDRFIVKRVEHIFQNGALKTKIQAVRYDL